jgi:flagellar basal-body rod modification protein FlgD
VADTIPGVTGSQTSSTAEVKKHKSNLDKDDFLKLLTTQLTHQDPMNPTSDQEFIGTMAQFSALEQTTNMAKALEQMTFASQFSQSVALIGKNVDYTVDKATASGAISSVAVKDGKIQIKIGDKTVTPDSIVGVS